MHTRVLMFSSALFMAVLGLATSFFPQEVLAMHDSPADNATVLLIQMMGALYFGFAAVNWSARGVLMGGIYARPLAIGNFLHFAMVAITLSKAAIAFGVIMLAVSALVFTIFATWFGLVLFTHPGARRPHAGRVP